jgi:hypothetical protein
MAGVHTYKQLGRDVTIFGIDHSVGRGRMNRTDDVQLIQIMINRYICTTTDIHKSDPKWNALVLDESRRQIDKLDVDGWCGRQTLAAILATQKSLHRWKSSAVDGRIDPIPEGGASQYEDGTTYVAWRGVEHRKSVLHRIMNTRFNTMYVLAVIADLDPNPPWNIFLLPEPLKSSLLRSSISKSINYLARLGQGR